MKTKNDDLSIHSVNAVFRDQEVLSAIKYVPIDVPKRYSRRLRRAKKRQQAKYKAFTANCGVVLPVLLDGDDNIVHNQEMFEAARELGYTKIPIIRITHLSPEQVRVVRLALDRLPELGEWDKEALAIELEELLEIDFSVDVSGFDLPEIDGLIDEQLLPPSGSPADDIPEPAPLITTRIGDVWVLDDHRVGCLDARNPESYAAILGEKRADMVFVDGPFNVRIDGHVCGSGKTQHNEFIMASGEMSKPEFADFNGAYVRNLVRFSLDGSVHYLCMDWRHQFEFQAVCEQHYDIQLNLCVWAKPNGGMGSHYRSRHELVLVYRNGKAHHINNVQLGRFGRNRTNVWEYDGVNSFSRRADLALHPTTKPIDMVADAIRDSSHRGGIVLDPFLGSGTTLIACEDTGRRCAGLELDPTYVDVIIRRWEKFTAHEAHHAVTGMTFREMTAMRTSAVPLLPPPAKGEG